MNIILYDTKTKSYSLFVRVFVAMGGPRKAVGDGGAGGIVGGEYKTMPLKEEGKERAVWRHRL